MSKIFFKHKFKFLSAFLVIIFAVLYFSMNLHHYNFTSKERCQECHLQDGDLVFVNADLKANYTSSESCKECHEEVYEAYMKTPTGNSMSRLTEDNVIEKFPQNYTVYDSIKNYYYEMVKKNGKFFQREYRIDSNNNIVHERWMEAQYIIGSGSNLRIYFYDENGMFYELPLTWYVHKQKWDLSPGYREFDNNRFSRYVGKMCFACHNGHMERVEGANDRYKKPVHLGIGCEDCHGPGELHIKQFKDKSLGNLPEFVVTTVNPAKLSPERRNDVCLQCHIEGKSWALLDKKDWFDFRPGFLLKEHRSVFKNSQQSKHTFLVADTGNRMFLSPCFSGSHGQLTCDFCHTSHNIHEVDKIKFNRQSCMRCHPMEGLPMRESRFAESRENCNRCHMNEAPADNTLHGVIDTDHWIRINSDWDQVDWKPEREHSEKLVLTPIVDKADYESQIRTGIAYAEYYFFEDRSDYYLDSAYYNLVEGIRKSPNSINGNYYLGRIERIKKKYKESEYHLNLAIKLFPELSEAYYELAMLYKKQSNFSRAIISAKKAIEIKKIEPTYLELLGLLYYESDSLQQAYKILNESIKIDRQNPNVFFILGNISVFLKNDLSEALEYYKNAVELDPDFPDALINLGNTYALIGDLNKAIETYKKEILFRKNSVKAYLNLAKIYEYQGNNKEAGILLKQAKLIDPDLQY